MALTGLAGCVGQRKGQLEPEEIADYLYETTYTEDFNWDDAASVDLSFACAGIQNGQYHSRNYDRGYTETDLCVLHATVAKKRPHASVGVVDMSDLLDEDGTYDCSNLPFFTADGINDAGSASR